MRIGQSLVMVGGLAVLAAVATFLVRRPTSDEDPMPYFNSSEIVRQSIEDYVWWKGKLPTRYSDIEPMVNKWQGDFVPPKGSIVTWRKVPGTVEDKVYGGQLAQVEIKIVGPNGYLWQKVEPIEMRDKDRIWKPHFSSMNGYGNGDLVKTPKNLADTVAEAIWRSAKDQHRFLKTWESVKTDSMGSLAIDEGAQTLLSLQVNSTEIILTAKDGAVYRYPLKGPAYMNSKVPPESGLH